jgi:hypothetical protein
MKQSLRKTPSHVHLAYKYGEGSGGLLGRNLTLEVAGELVTLEIDLSGNLKARNKTSPWYVDAVNLQRHHHKLKLLQIPDNLVRSRLIKAWEALAHPKMRLVLLLGEGGGSYLYEVAPHSLFTGGIQFDVQAFLEGGLDEGATRHWSPAHDIHIPHRNHA